MTWHQKNSIFGVWDSHYYSKQSYIAAIYFLNKLQPLFLILKHHSMKFYPIQCHSNQNLHWLPNLHLHQFVLHCHLIPALQPKAHCFLVHLQALPLAAEVHHMYPFLQCFHVTKRLLFFTGCRQTVILSFSHHHLSIFPFLTRMSYPHSFILIFILSSEYQLCILHWNENNYQLFIQISSNIESWIDDTEDTQETRNQIYHVNILK